jgi:hypothetical protein
MLFGLFKRKKDDESTRRRKEQEAEDERREAEAVKQRRDAAAKKVVDDMRAAREAREAQDAAEDEACKTIGISQANTDTRVREVKKKQGEISGVMNPVNGKSVQELALEAIEAEERGA